MGWPDAAEFANFLYAAGLRAAAPTDVQQALDLDGALEAAISDWEDMTHYWPFLSTGNVNETRTFAPRGGTILDLNGGADYLH